MTTPGESPRWRSNTLRAATVTGASFLTLVAGCEASVSAPSQPVACSYRVIGGATLSEGQQLELLNDNGDVEGQLRDELTTGPDGNRQYVNGLWLSARSKNDWQDNLSRYEAVVGKVSEMVLHSGGGEPVELDKYQQVVDPRVSSGSLSFVTFFRVCPGSP